MLNLEHFYSWFTYELCETHTKKGNSNRNLPEFLSGQKLGFLSYSSLSQEGVNSGRL